MNGHRCSMDIPPLDLTGLAHLFRLLPRRGLQSLFAVIVFLLYGSSPVEAENNVPTPQSFATAAEAVRFALVNNPDTAITRQRIAAAQAAVTEAHASFFPQLDLSASYGRTNTPLYSFGNILNQAAFDESINFNDPGETDNLNMAATVSYRLYNGGRDQAGVDIAIASETASRHELEIVHSQLSFEVVKTICTIVQAKENLDARQSALQAITASVEVARSRYEAGDLLKADLLNLEVHRSEAEENFIHARHALDLTNRAFLNLLGLEQGDISIHSAGTMEQSLPADLSYDRRPELKAMDAAIQAAEAGVRQAEGGYFPTADAFAGYQVDRGYELDGSGNSWIAGAKLNFNLFAGQRTSAQVARAIALLAEKIQERRKIVLAISLEVEQASLALQQAEQRMQVTAKMLEQAKESANLSRERFKEGIILSSELIDVENRLTEAMVRGTLARAARRIAVANLRKATGLGQFDLAEVNGTSLSGS
ncbi:MAG TPA: TolC family protein [Desulfobulbaceae bacterium]|nr:TolC family protein [Desulfobulbaceae bacterium]